MFPDSSIGGHEATEPWDHPRVMEGHRMPLMTIGGHVLPRLVFTRLVCPIFLKFILRELNDTSFKRFLKSDTLLTFVIFGKFEKNHPKLY